MSIYDLISVLGGLGLFLFGMKLMGEGLELASGSKLRSLLEKLTSNRFIAMLVGLGVTAVIQSSSATDAMVVGFANAGLMELSQAVGILFGAKIGTTVTSLLLAIDIKKIVPLFIFIGVVIITFSKKSQHKFYGQIIAGFGILFFGMTVMSGSLSGLSESELFTNVISNFKNPLIGILSGLLFTTVIQSSSASVGILMALGMAGAINLEQAVYIIYGFNIGASAPAFLSSIGANRTAKQISLINFIITVIGAVFMVLITMTCPIVDIIKTVIPGNVGAQISATHIMFNIVITCVLLPFSSLLIKLTKLILPDKNEEKEKMGTVYLDPRILGTPPMAVLQAEKECLRLAELSRKNFKYSCRNLFEHDPKLVEKVMENEKVIDYVTHCITEYIVKINALDISDNDRSVMSAMYSAIQDIERIGDRAVNLIELGEQMENKKLSFTEHAIEELKDMCGKCEEILDSSVKMFTTEEVDPSLSGTVNRLEDEIDVCTDKYKFSHIKRLDKGICSGEAGAVFLDILINLERVGDHAENVAFAIPNRNRYASITEA